MDPNRDYVLPKIIPFHDKLENEEFMVPSVFSRSGWVRRKLQVKELGALLDVS